MEDHILIEGLDKVAAKWFQSIRQELVSRDLKYQELLSKYNFTPNRDLEVKLPTQQSIHYNE